MITSSLQNIQRKPYPRSLMILAALALSLPLTSSAAQLYRYKDDQGNYVLNQMIPPKYVSKGYDILNSKGRVLRTIAPALSPEEIAARDAAIEMKRLEEVERQKQELIDNELKQLYSHPDDAVRVLSRRVQDILGVIEVKHNNIDSTRNKILDEESRAADRQRKGLSIEGATLTKLDKLRADILNSERDIVELNEELKKVKVLFNTKIRRLEIITGKQASSYSQELIPGALQDSHSAVTETGSTSSN